MFSHWEIVVSARPEVVAAAGGGLTKRWITRVMRDGVEVTQQQSIERAGGVREAAMFLRVRLEREEMAVAQAVQLRDESLAQVLEEQAAAGGTADRPAGQVEDWVRLAPPAAPVEDGGGL